MFRSAAARCDLKNWAPPRLRPPCFHSAVDDDTELLHEDYAASQMMNGLDIIDSPRIRLRSLREMRSRNLVNWQACVHVFSTCSASEDSVRATSIRRPRGVDVKCVGAVAANLSRAPLSPLGPSINDVAQIVHLFGPPPSFVTVPFTQL